MFRDKRGLNCPRIIRYRKWKNLPIQKNYIIYSRNCGIQKSVQLAEVCEPVYKNFEKQDL